MGLVWNYEVTLAADGTQTIKHIDPAGLLSTTTIGADFSSTTTTPDGMVSKMIAAGDPRFGLANAQYPASITETTPAGLRSIRTRSRTVNLADPTNPLSSPLSSNRSASMGERRRARTRRQPRR
jgi:hypothetical protein